MRVLAFGKSWQRWNLKTLELELYRALLAKNSAHNGYGERVQVHEYFFDHVGPEKSRSESPCDPVRSVMLCASPVADFTTHHSLWKSIPHETYIRIFKLKPSQMYQPNTRILRYHRDILRPVILCATIRGG